MRSLALAVCLVLVPAVAAAQRAASAREATVLIRVTGDLQIEYERFGTVRSLEQRDVKIGTGSGFVISPFGYILTSHHVIGGGTSVELVEGTEVHVTRQVTGIEAEFPAPGPGGGPREVMSRLPATVAASDPDLDLAVLFVTGGTLPYLALGDSDAIELGQSVQVLGYPFGRAIEIALGGEPGVSDLTPRVSVSQGSVSAFRAGQAGDPRFVQIDASVNPGHSGGPTVDLDGYVVGVTQMKLVGGGRDTGIGFAVSINRVKDFLEAHGLDQILPSRRERLGPPTALEGKGLRLRFLDGRDDRSPIRTRVEGGRDGDEVWLRIERVSTPWSLEQLEESLLTRQAFERFSVSTPVSNRHRSGRVLRGHVGGTLAGPQGRLAAEMEYALVDLGHEKLVGRYLGPAEQVAFNEGVLRASLSSLEIESLLTAELARPSRLPGWLPAAPRSAEGPALVVPAGWRQEGGAPLSCPSLPPGARAVSASPEGDFPVQFRLAWWPVSSGEAERAVAGCARGLDAEGRPTYESRYDRVGTSHLARGVFVEPAAGGLLQAEVVSPLAKHEFVRELFAAWLAALSR